MTLHHNDLFSIFLKMFNERPTTTTGMLSLRTKQFFLLLFFKDRRSIMDTGCIFITEGKKLEIKFRTNVRDVHYYLKTTHELMRKQSIRLETIDLEMNLAMDFNEFNGCNVVYEPWYFHDLKSLTITAYSNESDFILNYLRISNVNLRELTIYGMTTGETFLDALSYYGKLETLKIGTRWIDETELFRLRSCPKLRQLILDVRHLDWHQNDIIEFLRIVPTIKLLVLNHDKRDDQFQFTNDFVQKFNELLPRRRQLKLIYLLAGREITMSKYGLRESVPRVGFSPE